MAKKTGADSDDVMSNPDYLRKSSEIITEALKKGFDVLQLENGDIVTTGTKVVVTTYRWDSKGRKMAKVSAKEKKANGTLLDEIIKKNN